MFLNKTLSPCLYQIILYHYRLLIVRKYLYMICLMGQHPGESALTIGACDLYIVDAWFMPYTSFYEISTQIFNIIKMEISPLP